jgi:hypothetical protein
MTPSELKYQHENHNPSSYFFSRNTMRFFGDTMRNFGVRNGGTAWILYTKRPTKAGHREWLFCKKTFQRLHNAEA